VFRKAARDRFVPSKVREEEKKRPLEGEGWESFEPAFLAVYQIVYKKFVFLNLFPYFCTVKPKMQEL
jgi:hypothetical protein